MMVLSGALTASGTRRLSPVQWNKDGCRGFDVQVREDVPAFDEGMIRRALLRGSLVCGDVDGLSLALNRKLWVIGYVHGSSRTRSIVRSWSRFRCPAASAPSGRRAAGRKMPRRR